MRAFASFFLFCSIFLISCNNNNSTIFLTTNSTFKLLDNEVIANNKSKFIKQYNTYFNKFEDIQIPLYKVIKGRNYTIFIGMPVDASASAIYTLIVESDDNNSFESRKINDTTFQMWKKQHSLRMGYCFVDLPDDQTYAFYLITKDNSVIENFYNNDFLKDRINFNITTK